MGSVTLVSLNESGSSFHGSENNIGILDLAFKSLSLNHLVHLDLLAQLVQYVPDFHLYKVFLVFVRSVFLHIPQSLSLVD